MAYSKVDGFSNRQLEISFRSQTIYCLRLDRTSAKCRWATLQICPRVPDMAEMPATIFERGRRTIPERGSKSASGIAGGIATGTSSVRTHTLLMMRYYFESWMAHSALLRLTRSIGDALLADSAEACVDCPNCMRRTFWGLHTPISEIEADATSNLRTTAPVRSSMPEGNGAINKLLMTCPPELTGKSRCSLVDCLIPQTVENNLQSCLAK